MQYARFLLHVNSSTFLSFFFFSFKTTYQSTYFYRPTTAAETYDYFLTNFQRYSANRTPFGVYQHVYWFNGGNVALDGFVQFLDYLGTLDYVYIVTVSKV